MKELLEKGEQPGLVRGFHLPHVMAALPALDNRTKCFKKQSF
jgi:hypothetical protein